MDDVEHCRFVRPPGGENHFADGKRLNAAVNDLGFGQSMELLDMTQFTPYGGGMEPLDRAWNDPDLWKKK